MFERYTERARRVLFFARLEASRLGSHVIETEHLLLGLIRENGFVECDSTGDEGKSFTSRLLDQAHISQDAIRQELEESTVRGESIPTSVEIPFSAAAKRVLQYAAEESEMLLHGYLGTEHLLLALLREDQSAAATSLANQGLKLDAVRQQLKDAVGRP